MCLPSGLNWGIRSEEPFVVTWVTPEPSAAMSQMSKLRRPAASVPALEAKAIFEPSGDQAGSRSRLVRPLVSWVWLVPSGFRA